MVLFASDVPDAVKKQLLRGIRAKIRAEAYDQMVDIFKGEDGVVNVALSLAAFRSKAERPGSAPERGLYIFEPFGSEAYNQMVAALGEDGFIAAVVDAVPSSWEALGRTPASEPSALDKVLRPEDLILKALGTLWTNLVNVVAGAYGLWTLVAILISVILWLATGVRGWWGWLLGHF